MNTWSIGDHVMGIESGGCYAEKVVTHSRQALPVPHTIALSDAAAISEVFLTAWDALVVQGGLTSGRWGLIHAGASGVGTAGIQIAKAIGARIAAISPVLSRFHRFEIPPSYSCQFFGQFFGAICSPRSGSCGLFNTGRSIRLGG